jgi:CelD/BcsL family acetyltransferase involved in cellulose biosynthesis
VRRGAAWHRLPIPGTVTWATSYTFYGAPLLARERAAEGARGLLGNAVRGRNYLGLELLATDGAASHALERAAGELGLRTTVLRSYERALLRRRDDPRDYLQLKPKHRRELRRLRDRLAEKMQAPVEGHDESSKDAAISEFLELEASGWKRDAGTALALSGHGQMFQSVCRSFAERGRLQLLTLKAGDRLLAAKCNLLAGDGAFCFKIAFDEQFARYSPGVQLEVANVAHFHARPQLAWQDSCAQPGNAMINRLWPDRRPIALKAVTADSVSGRTTARLFRAAARARDLIKRGDES